MKKYSKNVMGLTMDTVIGGASIGIINNTDLPQPTKSVIGTAIGFGLVKKAGKKMKVF